MRYHFRRVLILFLFDLFISVLAYQTLAQNIPNGDFEEWTTNGQPSDWFTNNIYPPPFECLQVFMGYPSFSGNWCIEGVVDTCPQLVQLLPPHIWSYNIPLENRPEALHGFYRFLPVDDDRFSSAIRIYKNNTVIGEGILVSEQEVTSFTEFIINLNYTTNDTPNVAVIEFTIDSSGTSNKLHQGSKWYIDYLFFGPLSNVSDDGIYIPNTFLLSQNYPNPFNPSTKIKYSIPELSIVTFKVYDVLGNELMTLLNEEKAAGIYEVELNAERLTSGVYYYQLKVGNYLDTKKMVLVK